MQALYALPRITRDPIVATRRGTAKRCANAFTEKSHRAICKAGGLLIKIVIKVMCDELRMAL